MTAEKEELIITNSRSKDEIILVQKAHNVLLVSLLQLMMMTMMKMEMQILMKMVDVRQYNKLKSHKTKGSSNSNNDKSNYSSSSKNNSNSNSISSSRSSNRKKKKKKHKCKVKKLERVDVVTMNSNKIVKIVKKGKSGSKWWTTNVSQTTVPHKSQNYLLKHPNRMNVKVKALMVDVHLVVWIAIATSTVIIYKMNQYGHEQVVRKMPSYVCVIWPVKKKILHWLSWH